MKRVFFNLLVLLLIFLSHSMVKTTYGQGIKLKVLEEIYRKYDSVPFITFNVKYVYTSDTIHGEYQYDVLNGSYTLAGKYARFTLGDIDYMQNDSFFIAVYNQDKYMLVNDVRWQNSASQMPARNYIDSMVMTLGKNYHVSLGLDKTVGKISLKRANDRAQFDLFQIEYDLLSRLFQVIQYDYIEDDIIEFDDYDTTVTRKKSFRIEFSNYRLDNFSDSVFDINNYIWFDRNECLPVEKYSGFKVYYSRSPQRVALKP